MLSGSCDIKINERIFSLCTLFIFLFDFRSYSLSVNADSRICWPHWEQCREFLKLKTLPDSYEINVLFAILFAIIIVGIFGVFKGKEKYYFGSLWILTLFKFFYQFVWHFSGMHNFELFHLIPTFAFLINKKDRIWGAQVSWAICYFLAAFVKIHESWIVGSYFSSLSLGLPLVPKIFIPFLTQSVIIFEIFLSWGLLSEKYRKFSLVLWTIFHVYSVVLVGYYYPTRCILILYSLFLGKLSEEKKFLKISPLSLLFFGIVIFFQVVPLLYSEDQKRTLRFEGYAYNMIDANFQCVNKTTKVMNGLRQEQIEQNTSSMHRCSPRLMLERIKIQCEKNANTQMEWILYQSINGNPFYEIVNEVNACELKFSLFGENKWIKNQSDKIVGYPKHNAVTGNQTFQMQAMNSIIFKDRDIENTSIQTFILNRYNYFYSFYLLLWVGMFTWVCFSNLRSKK